MSSYGVSKAGNRLFLNVCGQIIGRTPKSRLIKLCKKIKEQLMNYYINITEAGMLPRDSRSIRRSKLVDMTLSVGSMIDGRLRKSILLKA